MELVAHFRRMARNNAWSNHRLLTACGALSPDDYHATRVSFFPSIAATLNHILLVDLYYLDALEGSTLGYSCVGAWQDRPDFAALAADQRATDRRLMAFCDAQSPENLKRMIGIDRGPLGIDRETISDTLSHIFVHQIHHRGQVHAMLAGTSVPPPQLDEYFLAFDAPSRGPDLQALGLEGPEAIQ
jgi:uncharacterized damage-inducible protein DinB